MSARNRAIKAQSRASERARANSTRVDLGTISASLLPCPADIDVGQNAPFAILERFNKPLGVVGEGAARRLRERESMMRYEPVRTKRRGIVWREVVAHFNPTSDECVKGHCDCALPADKAAARLEERERSDQAARDRKAAHAARMALGRVALSRVTGR